MKTAKVVIEISLRTRVPKKVLEQMVMHFSEKKAEMLASFKKHDDAMSCRVYYEDYSGIPQISFVDILKRRRNKRAEEKAGK